MIWEVEISGSECVDFLVVATFRVYFANGLRG
jgi:hypothetical protein